MWIEFRSLADVIFLLTLDLSKGAILSTNPYNWKKYILDKGKNKNNHENATNCFQNWFLATRFRDYMLEYNGQGSELSIFSSHVLQKFKNCLHLRVKWKFSRENLSSLHWLVSALKKLFLLQWSILLTFTAFYLWCHS